MPPMISITSLVSNSFQAARARYPTEMGKWSELSARLAGRSGVVPLQSAVQSAGEFDAVLRGMEDEFSQISDTDPFAAHYQIMLSEAWVLECYEPLRVVGQRDRERADLAKRSENPIEADAVSSIPEFKEAFGELELLRMPIAKFEIAKDDKIKTPLSMRTVGEGPVVCSVYDRNDPGRVHIMPAGINHDGRIGWQVLDHQNRRQFWIERRSLSDKLLALAALIEPAGLREARLIAEGVK